MAENKVIPADIQADAETYSKSLDRGNDCNWHPKSFSQTDYIQGRMDERDKSWTDEDVLNAFKAGESNKQSEIVSYGMLGSAIETTFKQKPIQWLEDYKNN